MFEKLTRSQKIGALLLIVVLGLVLRLGGLERVGFNEDEVHKVEAARAYLHGDFSNNLEHPMLMKSLIALSGRRRFLESGTGAIASTVGGGDRPPAQRHLWRPDSASAFPVRTAVLRC